MTTLPLCHQCFLWGCWRRNSVFEACLISPNLVQSSWWVRALRCLFPTPWWWTKRQWQTCIKFCSQMNQNTNIQEEDFTLRHLLKGTSETSNPCKRNITYISCEDIDGRKIAKELISLRQNCSQTRRSMSLEVILRMPKEKWAFT